jgi:hypothetical protein
MAVRVIVDQHIARPPADVAAFATDPANDTRWIGALQSARKLTAGPFGIGTQVERTASFLGRKIEYVLEIAGLEVGRKVEMRSIKAPFPMTVTYAFEPDGDGTRMSIETGCDASGFYALAAPLLSIQVKRGVAGDLKRLKQILESAADSS